MIYIISYPRSGNTAFRYLIEHITRLPTNGLCGEPNAKDILQKPLLFNGTNFVAHKRHDFREVKPNDMVFFIVRDYIEAIIRHNEHRGITEAKFKKWIDSWFSLLNEYDNHPGEKMLIYYESLVEVAFQESKSIYPNPQSNDLHHHKRKLNKEVLKDWVRYAESNYYDLISKYNLKINTNYS